MVHKFTTDVSPSWVRCAISLLTTGRRALKTYMSLFLYDSLLQSSRIGADSDDLEYLQGLLSTQQSMDQIISTQQLGGHVGRALGLEKVMRWHPAVRVDTVAGTRETGLFKVRGTCVEAVLGAIYHYRGAQVAQYFFMSKILPNLETLNLAPTLVRKRIAEVSVEATQALARSP